MRAPPAYAILERMNATNASPLAELSAELAAAVANVGASVVYVDAHPRRDASGIAWDEHHIVTVEHAIEREEDIEVLLADGATARASLVGRDETTDVAVLHTDATLVPVRRAEAATLGVGNIVLAVGRDEDGAPGASFGVVSSLDGPWRTWRGGDVDERTSGKTGIEIEVGTNEPVDVAGAAVGMNTWGLSRRMALTLPLTTVARVVAQLQSGGRIARGYLGIAMQAVRLPESLRRSHGLAQGTGAIVVDVAPDGPADRAGMLIGDVLLALGTRPVEDSDDVAAALGGATIGTQQPLKILRGGEARTLTVTIGERKRDDD
jgi:S1-C subfamily serine protease